MRRSGLISRPGSCRMSSSISCHRSNAPSCTFESKWAASLEASDQMEKSTKFGCDVPAALTRAGVNLNGNTGASVDETMAPEA
eukprot:scaffold213003_cov31-Tisochrysis_lutea.AAC.7